MEEVYKRKFKIKIDKLAKGDFQLGLFFVKQTYTTLDTEHYLYICFIKWNISIGWLLR